MLVKQYIKDFEKLGFGMFVHFGLYSMLGKGEWSKLQHNIPDSEYEALAQSFCPKEDWADRLAETAKAAGCKYITLTTRHHDGFSLFDTKGLSSYDSLHSLCKRDLVKEFVDACRKNDVIPFFYHTLIDWHEPSFKNDFKAYLKYLRDSVEILCRDYGKIGGIWFDGIWDKPDADWEEDALYGLIRRYQPDAMIINNTGMSERGKLGHIELDSVTFERGKPQPINLVDSPKYVASEMCEVFNDHWGYASEDLNYKSPAEMICEFAECRKFGSNFLLNAGPMENGYLRPVDSAYFGIIGEWVRYFKEALYETRPSGIEVVNKAKDFILKRDNCYYLFCFDLQMAGDENVALKLKENEAYEDIFEFNEKIESVTWLDNGASVSFSQNGSFTRVFTEPFRYGRNLVVRVAKISV